MSNQHEREFGKTLKRFGDGLRDQSARTGLTIQNTLSRREKMPTLSIEMAPIPAPGHPPLWEQKVSVQLDEQELVLTVAVILGLLPSVQAAFHGDQNNKNFAVHNNRSQGLVLALGQQGRQLKHFVPRDGVPSIAAFAVKRLSTAWEMSPVDAMAILKQTVRNG